MARSEILVGAQAGLTRPPPVEYDQSDQSGFYVAYDSATSKKDERSKVDIVAIHGIGTHRIGTWTHSKSKVNWLRDAAMLPSRVSNNCRILLYGFSSDWKGEQSINATVSTIARKFVDRLLEKRNGLNERPLIFIAHCFGGIVLMKAMTMFKHRHLELLRPVVGLLFFGTPFRGVSGSLSNGEMVKYLVDQGEFVQPNILSVLVPNNDTLIDIREEFTGIKEDALPLPQIYCYFESKPARVWGIAGDRERAREFVVSRDSATFDGSEARSLDRDHFAMNKFESPDDEEFGDVARVIASLAQRGPHIVKDRSKWKVTQGPPVKSKTSAMGNSLWRRQPTFEAAVSEPPHSRADSGVVASPPLDPFSPKDWLEKPIPYFDANHHIYSVKLKSSKHGKFWKTPPFACGVAQDGRHVYTFGDQSLVIYRVPTIQVKEVTQFCHADAPDKLEFHAAQMAQSFIALVCTKNGRRTACRLYRIPLGQETGSQIPIWNRDDPSGHEYDCLAIHERPKSVLVALGRKSENTAQIQIYKISTITTPATGEPLCGPIDLAFDRLGHRLPICDHAKLLTFSRCGTMLMCCTRRQNKLLAWRLPPEPGNGSADELCSETRPFTQERDAFGITSTTCWTSSSKRPYMLVTTCPGSQRKHHEGEWSFIAPISRPFPTHTDDALHCLMAAQHKRYYSIMTGTVANKGNAIGLLSMRGEICITSLRELEDGGIGASEDAPTLLKKELTSPYLLHEAALTFTADDKRLIAVDKHGTLIIAEFTGG